MKKRVPRDRTRNNNALVGLQGDPPLVLITLQR